FGHVPAAAALGERHQPMPLGVDLEEAKRLASETAERLGPDEPAARVEKDVERRTAVRAGLVDLHREILATVEVEVAGDDRALRTVKRGGVDQRLVVRTELDPERVEPQVLELRPLAFAKNEEARGPCARRGPLRRRIAALRHRDPKVVLG